MRSWVSIGLCAAIFFVFSFLCITTHAPRIEEDIATRCREALAAHQIKPVGLSVSGRDVVLSGVEGSVIVSQPVRALLQRVNGVRSVRVQLLSAQSEAALDPGQEEPANSQVRAVQEKINAILQNQQMEFKPDSAALTPGAAAALNSIAPILAQAPSLRCEIRGNSSAPPNMQHEWMVALHRALATEDYLASKGIADWRLSAQVFPASGESAENRQIDFVVKER